MLLSSAMHILLSKCATLEELNKANSMLKLFVIKVEELYGKQHSTYNVHLLTHMVKYCEEWGLLWSWSAFNYEDLNGNLLKLFYGTQSVPLQMAKYFPSRQALIRSSASVFLGDDTNAHSFFKKLSGIFHISGPSERITGGLVVGPYILSVLSNQELFTTETKFGVSFGRERRFKKFKRCVIGSSIYCTRSYCRQFKRDNSCIKLGTQFGIIDSIYALPELCSCIAECNCLNIILFIKKITISNPIFSYFEKECNSQILHFVKKCEMTEIIQVFKGNEVSSKCFLIKHNTETFVMEMPFFEMDC